MTPRIDPLLLDYIDRIPGEVIRWRAEPGSTETYPLVHFTVLLPSPAEYIRMTLNVSR